MTTVGPCLVQGRYDDGDYQVTFPEGCEPQEVSSIKPKDLWLLSDWPDWSYDRHGERIGDNHDDFKHESKQRTPTMMADIESTDERTYDDRDDAKHETKQHIPARYETKQGVPATMTEIEIPSMGDIKKDENRHYTRSSTRGKVLSANVGTTQNTTGRGGPNQYKIWDRGKDTLKTAHYPYHELVKPLALSAKQNHLPAGFPLSPTMQLIETMFACDVERILPRHWHQTKGHPLESFLQLAEIKELQDCCNRGVFGEPEEITEDMVAIGLMWVYAIKQYDASGLFRKFRARITLLGNQEKHLLDKILAYAPVAQAVTARLMIASHLHLKGIIYRKLDVSNAYINEFMKRKVYCKMPPGYTLIVTKKGDVIFRRLLPGEKQSKKCALVIKALYGGMDCGRVFWESWVDWHIADGFQLIHEERCFLHFRDSLGNFIKLCYHVDDNLIIARGDIFYQAYLARLALKFDYTEGILDSHLGVAYHFDHVKGEVHIEQSAQTRKMLKEFSFEDCKPAMAPTMTGPPPCAADCDEPYDGKWDMEAFIGHANYLHMCTRPDIGQVLKILSRFTKNFGRRHVEYAKHLLRYLKGTINEGLVYRTGFPLYYQIFTDASHASCVDTRRSIVSIVVKLGGNTVYWKNSFTKIVSHSSTESELMALDVGATIGQCLRWLIESIGGPVQGRIQIFVDNTGTISIASNPIQPGRNLHVHARYFYVRDLVYDDLFDIVHLPTNLQVADVGCTFKGGNIFLILKAYLMTCARIMHDDNDIPFWDVRMEM